MGPVVPVLGLLGAAPERFWTAMMGRMMADGKMAVGGTQKLGKKLKNDFCDLIFITPVVEQVLLDLPAMVLPSDETSNK